jgi:hypothetical protein
MYPVTVADPVCGYLSGSSFESTSNPKGSHLFNREGSPAQKVKKV